MTMIFIFLRTFLMKIYELFFYYVSIGNKFISLTHVNWFICKVVVNRACTKTNHSKWSKFMNFVFKMIQIHEFTHLLRIAKENYKFYRKYLFKYEVRPVIKGVKCNYLGPCQTCLNFWGPNDMIKQTTGGNKKIH